MRTCTWAPTVFQGTQVVGGRRPQTAMPAGADLRNLTVDLVQRYESMGFSDLLIAQRWWGSGTDIEASSLDCLAMTALFAGVTERINLITAIHPGFFLPSAIAKWGASLQAITSGRWAINVTSGWNMAEFDMYGVDKLDHDERYRRTAEFITVLRGAWSGAPFSHEGHYYATQALELEPKPQADLEVFQGGQSDAARDLAAAHSDWMFLNGASPEKAASIIADVRSRAEAAGRRVRFAMYAQPVCRATDDEAWAEVNRSLAAVDQTLLRARHERLAEGARGMWSDTEDPLAALDTNEGYVPRLIGRPDQILERIQTYRDLGIDMLHLDARDGLFNTAVLPELTAL